jgi:RHS repeat-associated protein
MRTQNPIENSFIPYSFNGMEKDEEVKGEGNSYTTEFRQLDPRLGRWLSLDPVVHHFQSPYCSMDNNPIFFNDTDGQKVKPMSEEALNLIKNGLTEDEAKFVKLNKDGFIKTNSLKKGLRKLDNVGENYNSLLTLCSDEEILEVHVSTFLQYVDFNGKTQTLDFEIPELISEREVWWSVDKEMYESAGKTYENWLEAKGKNYSDIQKWEALFGLTLHPDYSKNGGGHGKSLSGNHEVYINCHATELNQVTTQAHESYGHALFKFLGKPNGHTVFDKTDPNYNTELENHINKSEEEAERNYKSKF